MKKLLIVAFLAIICSACTDYAVSTDIEYKNNSSYDIQFLTMSTYINSDNNNVYFVEEPIVTLSKGSTYTFSASDMGTKKGYLSFYFAQIHNAIHYIQIGDKVKVAYSGRYSDENNYELLSEKERYRKYTYTFTDADYQFALENGTLLE